MSKYTIVDRNDIVLTFKDSKDLDFSKEIYRVAGLWLTDTSGRVLIAQRSLNKVNNPGLWGPAVAGTVEEGETYDANIYKEAEEELGLTGLQFKVGAKVLHSDDGRRTYFCQWFTAQTEAGMIDDFVLQADEVDAVAWIALEDLQNDVRQNPTKYIANMEVTVRQFS